MKVAPTKYDFETQLKDDMGLTYPDPIQWVTIHQGDNSVRIPEEYITYILNRMKGNQL